MVDNEDTREAAHVLAERLPRPEPPHRSFPIMAVFGGAIVALVAGVALFIASRVFYIYILYNALLGLAIGWAMASGPEHHRYTNRAMLFCWTLVCSLIAYLSYNAAFFVYVLSQLKGPTFPFPSIDWLFGFFAFVAVRAETEPFIGSVKIGTVGNAIVWLVELAITLYYAWRRVATAVLVCHVESVPAEVTSFVLNMLAEGSEPEEVSQQLAQRGWTEPADQWRAFQAATSFVSLIRQAAGEEES